MAKITLSDIAGGYNAPAKINANNALIEAAIENTLSRDGTSPNQMEVNLDMNGFRFLNVGSPQGPLDVARLVDITGFLTLTGAEIPSMVGNAGKVISTDGVSMYWTDIPASALPLFTDAVKGAVGPSGGGTTKTLWADGTWETPAVKNAYAQTNVQNLWGVGQKYTFSTVSFGSPTTTIDTSLGNIYKVTLTGNTTIAFSNAANGRKFKLYIKQDGTGGRTITWPTVKWAADSSPVLSASANAVNWVELDYDGTDWYGSWDQIGTAGVGPDPSAYDLVIDGSETHVDLFRRLGSPVVSATWEIAISPGAVIHSPSTSEVALDLSGAFPSGTIINILNQGYVIGKGGRGADAIGGQDAGDAVFSIGYNQAEAGGAAVNGPATGVTVNITNANGFVWGGGGGGGSGACECGDTVALGGAGGGGAGLGQGGRGAYMKRRGDTENATAPNASHGKLNLDGTAAGGAAGAGASGSSGSPEVETGGAGGDYGSAGSAGGATSTNSGLSIPATAGGAAGRAVLAGYAGTINFLSGGSSPNVKGAL